MQWLRGFVDHPLLLLIALLIAAPVMYQYWKWFFGDLAGFGTDAKDAAIPDWYAFLRGRYWQGEWAELKIIVFLLLFVGVVAALYKIGTAIFF
jgi:hypothetical protein